MNRGLKTRRTIDTTEYKLQPTEVQRKNSLHKRGLGFRVARTGNLRGVQKRMSIVYRTSVEHTGCLIIPICYEMVAKVIGHLMTHHRATLVVTFLNVRSHRMAS